MSHRADGRHGGTIGSRKRKQKALSSRTKDGALLLGAQFREVNVRALRVGKERSGGRGRLGREENEIGRETA